jgi:hypothetical protein
MTDKFMSDVDENSKVEFVCWDWDRVGRDFMGEFTLSSEDLRQAKNASVEKWYPLQKRSMKDEISGEILLRFQLVMSQNVHNIQTQLISSHNT